MEKRRLGKGLDALLSTETMVSDSTPEVSVERIDQSPFQPRKTFDPDELTSLSASLKEHGILQPLVVRAVGDRYQLVAGERRLRAAQEAGMTSVPIRVVDFNDQQVSEAALAENIHRSDLNPIEKAQGFKDYLERFEVSHDVLAQRLGLARSSITNLVNLLELPGEIQEGLRLNQITEAHAKIIKGVRSKDRQVSVYKQVVAMGLSVKATESMVREQKDNHSTAGSKPATREREEPSDNKSPHVRGLEDELRKRLATPVEIKVQGKDRGQIVIRFETNDDFTRILEALGVATG